LQLTKTTRAGSLRPDLIAMRGAIDSLLKYLLRSICTHVAGEFASGTLWLRDQGAEGCRLRFVLRNGALLNRQQMRRLSVSDLQLLESELPSSGAPACSPGHGLHHWHSCNVGGARCSADGSRTSDCTRGATAPQVHLIADALKKRQT
jgi:hypothetical protein